MPESVLFRVEEVQVALADAELPGPSRNRAVCARCGQVVRDGREVEVEGKPLCKPCAQGAYFQNRREISWRGMNQAPFVRGAVNRLDVESKDRRPPFSSLPAQPSGRSEAIDQEDTH
jgi:hypothetical protein